MKLGILSTHPIQYYSPLYRELASRPELTLTVYYAYQATPADQAKAGFGVAFEWDVPLLEGYHSKFLNNVSRAPSTSTYRGCDTPEIADVIARENFDAFLVHGWYTKSYWQAMRACWRTSTPIMIRGDSTLLMKKRGWARRAIRWILHRRFIPRFNAYLVVGERAREYYLAYGADASRMVHSPHFVENARFAKASAAEFSNRAELRRKWELPADTTVFLFVGKFVDRKRPLDFLQAIEQASLQGLPVAGLLVGDGPLRGEIEQFVANCSVPIRLTGFLNQTQIPAAYASADALVMCSSEMETWGLVVNEAMACGLPAIVSDRVGCAPDLVLEDKTGYVYPATNVDALKDCLIRLSANAELRARLAATARDRIMNYSVEAAADGVCQAMRQLQDSSFVH